MKKKVARKPAKKPQVRSRTKATERVLKKMKDSKPKKAAVQRKTSKRTASPRETVKLHRIDPVVLDMVTEAIENQVAASIAHHTRNMSSMVTVGEHVGVIRRQLDPTFLKELFASDPDDLTSRTIDNVPAIAIRGLLDLFASVTLAETIIADITSDDDAGYSHSDPADADDEVREKAKATIDDDEL